MSAVTPAIARSIAGIVGSSIGCIGVDIADILALTVLMPVRMRQVDLCVYLREMEPFWTGRFQVL